MERPMTLAKVESFTDAQLKEEFKKIQKALANTQVQAFSRTLKRIGPQLEEPSSKQQKFTKAPIPSVPDVPQPPVGTSPKTFGTRRKSLGRNRLTKPKSILKELDLDADRYRANVTMSSATSDVTYTSVYTDSEPGRAFWGADDEEISEGGIPRVIVLGYDGLPLQPVAPPSPDYIPGPEDPQILPVPQDEDEREPMFIQAHDPDYVPEPIYPEYIPLEDDHEFPAETAVSCAVVACENEQQFFLTYAEYFINHTGMELSDGICNEGIYRFRVRFGLASNGTALVNEWQTKWNQLPKDHQARLKARQGVNILTLADVDVKNKDTMENVPHDGITIEEIVLRGSNIMKGYLKDEKDCQSLLERMVLDYFTGV
ncbi:hypothetical protein Tco_0088812 [Tanacetum coccineum]